MTTSKENLDDGNPLDTKAVIAADGPGIHITFIPFDLTFFISSSPGSQIPGIPASLTSATDFPELSSLIILGVL